MIDYIEHFFCECPVVQELWKFLEKTIYQETNIKRKLSTTDKLFGVSNSHLSKFEYKYINQVILIAKMCISIAKNTESALPIQTIFEREINLRQVVAQEK